MSNENDKDSIMEMIKQCLQEQGKMPPFEYVPLIEGFIEPYKGTERSAAIDLVAQEDFTIRSDRKILVKLGFKGAVPEGYCALLMPRSGQGTKAGVHLTNTVGLIDDDYRNEWMANLHLDQFTDQIGDDAELIIDDSKLVKILNVKKGERFIQVLFIKKEEIELKKVEELDKTSRTGGFGSTTNVK